MASELWDRASESIEGTNRPPPADDTSPLMQSTLNEFLEECGESAKRLLKAAKRSIVLVTREEDGQTVNYVLNENGFVAECAGQILDRSFNEIAKAINRSHAPGWLPSFLCDELDTIAKEILP